MKHRLLYLPIILILGFPILIGLLCISCALIDTVSDLWPRYFWTQSTGEVTEIMYMGVSYEPLGGYYTAYCPKVQFITSEGQHITTGPDRGTCILDHHNELKTGDQVDIYYNPQMPKDFYLKGDLSSKIGAEIFAKLGGVLLFLGLILNTPGIIIWFKDRLATRQKSPES